MKVKRKIKQKTKRIRQFILIGGLIAVTCLAMAYSGNTLIAGSSPGPSPGPSVSSKNGIVTLSGSLTQTKVFSGSNGIISLALVLHADEIKAAEESTGEDDFQGVDMVIVLDRSGSMSGQKINDAKKAALNLVEDLMPSDRFALVTYSNDAIRVSNLDHVTPGVKKRLRSAIDSVYSGGGTNLGRGLQEGINILTSAQNTGNLGRVILISDGLANQGITNPVDLGNMAAIATEKNFSITTVGVGHDFNEQLMTAIADRGTGNYYYLENPAAFASVFKKEFHRTREVAASAVKINVRLKDGIRLVDAGGYPITYKNNSAIFYPGNLCAGETRKLFLNFQIPTSKEKSFELSDIGLQYVYQDKPYQVKLDKPFRVACVKDPAEAIASIDKETWGRKVVKEDFNRLKEEVAIDIKSGRQNEAMKKIDLYQSTQQEINAQVQSPSVAANLENDLKDLRDTVADTFSGDAGEVAEKQKKNSKAIQYEGYSDRRLKK
jgi:Ca-activated chloride channel family protein